ncbi:MAG: winged helix-turn-helix domain-containing protein, partial [Acidobacteriota bacterium]|nr:winged helix-turn-helix domain-containing protein [Acidobacteriota bacterium]
MTKRKGPEFLRFCVPIIEVLRELGGSGRPAEVTDLVIERMNIPEDEQEITNKNGGSRIRNQVAWARFYLVRAGLLSSSQRGVWGLTEKGANVNLNDEFVLELFREVHQQFIEERKARKSAEKIVEEDDADASGTEVDADYKVELLSMLQSLPPEGFERICQRLLRESGFQQVTVTGKTGDGGIDGHGILQINPIVS